MSAPVEILAATLPQALRDALAQASDPARARLELDAVVLVADISGFTAISADLASRGAAGPEELSALLNGSFSALVDLVALYGGDIASFAGDAFVAFWPVRERPLMALKLAVGLAQAMPVAASRPGGMPPGTPEIRLRVGVARGPLVLAPVGGQQGRWRLLVAGEAVAEAADIQREAPPGGTALTPEVCAALGDEITTTPLQRGFLLDGLNHGPVTAPSRAQTPPAALAPALRPFVASAVLERLDAGLSAWVAELRPITVLFARLPALLVREPPPTEVLQAVARAVQGCLDRVEGVLDKFGVDDKGLFVLAGFGLPPFAHEDDALRGTRAALAMRDALADEGHSATIGVATGRVFCGTLGGPGRWEYTMLGEVVNRAARLMQRAGLGEVLCDETTHDAVGSRMAWEVLEGVQLKGVRGPLSAFRPLGVLSPATGASRREALVGRDRERAALRAGVERLLSGDPGELVIVRGDAGIGKSRLLSDLRGAAEALGARVVHTSADAIERLTPYHAWRPVFVELLGVRGRAGREAARARLPALLGPESEPLLPLLEVVLPLGLQQNAATSALNPEARAERTRALMVELLAAFAAREPLVLVLDEIHWFDSASWLLLEAICQEIPRLHLVVATRPLEGERRANLDRLSATPRARALDLDPLTPEAVLAVAQGVLGWDALPPGMARALIARAQGNPFYAAELALALKDRTATEDGSPWQTLAPASLPSTVEGALASRIDRLAPEASVALKAASVFGRPFSEDDLLAIHPIASTPERLRGTLEALVKAGLLARSREDLDARWVIASALVRDAAYGLMTFAQRKSLHAAVAVRMEGQRAEGTPVALPVLAFHWTRAEVVDRAVAALDAAGEEASGQFALEEMYRFFRKALELAPEAAPDRRGHWLLHIGIARLRLGLPDEAREHLLGALVLRGEDPPRTPRSALLPLVGQALRAALHLGGWRRGGARRTDRWEARCWLELGWAEYFRVEPVMALHAILRAVNAAEGLGPGYELTVGRATLSAFATFAGLRRPAARWRRLAEEGMAHTGDPATGGAALGVLGAAALARGDWEDARGLLERARELDAAAGLVEDRDLASILLGQTALATGGLAEAARWGELAREGGDRRGSASVRVRSRFFLGSVALARGDELGAARLLGEAGRIPGGRDVASHLAAEASLTLAALLEGDLSGGAARMEALLADPRLVVAAGAPALRLGEIVGLSLLRLLEVDTDRWRRPALAFLRAFRRRSRAVTLHAARAIELETRARALAGARRLEGT